MEHKLIRGGEQWLPFARSRIKALQATGLTYASQQFEIDGASVKVRITPGHEYISLEGAPLKIYLVFWQPDIELDFSPGAIYRTPAGLYSLGAVKSRWRGGTRKVIDTQVFMPFYGSYHIVEVNSSAHNAKLVKTIKVVRGEPVIWYRLTTMLDRKPVMCRYTEGPSWINGVVQSSHYRDVVYGDSIVYKGLIIASVFLLSSGTYSELLPYASWDYVGIRQESWRNYQYLPDFGYEVESIAESWHQFKLPISDKYARRQGCELSAVPRPNDLYTELYPIQDLGPDDIVEATGPINRNVVDFRIREAFLNIERLDAGGYPIGTRIISCAKTTCFAAYDNSAEGFDSDNNDFVQARYDSPDRSKDVTIEKTRLHGAWPWEDTPGHYYCFFDDRIVLVEAWWPSTKNEEYPAFRITDCPTKPGAASKTKKLNAPDLKFGDGFSLPPEAWLIGAMRDEITTFQTKKDSP